MEMDGMELNIEMREYQWRRKFERGPRQTMRSSLLVVVALLMLLIAGISLM